MTGRRSRRPSGERVFRRASATTIAVLLAGCAVFGVLGYATGPRLSEAVVGAAAVTRLPDQQLRLFADRLVAEVDPSEVEVEPAVPFTVSTSGR